jgi:opacity protein-like surface antigen
MDRRTFVVLSGTTASGLVRPRCDFDPRRLAARGDIGRLLFDFDAQWRWSLSYRAEGNSVPVIDATALGVWIEDRLILLADLQDITSEHRPTAEGEALAISGVAAGATVEAVFTPGPPGPVPRATITVTVAPDREQPRVRGVRYGLIATGSLIAGDGPLIALANGYQSWSANQIASLRNDTSLTSHGVFGVGRGSRGLALLFETGEPGEATVRIAGGNLDVRSDWLPLRPLRATGDGATLRFGFDPAGDAATALTALLQPQKDDRPPVTTPAGWCSWYQLYDKVTEAQVVANLEACATHFDHRFLRFIQIDDGFQKAAGDWDANDKFPHGHRWLTDQIHARGFQAGLWIAPFAVSEGSGVPASHPDWLLKQNGAPLVPLENAGWGGKVYAIDPAHPEVQEWLRQLARRIVRDWGYDYVKADFLHFATSGDGHAGGATHAEAYRAGVAALRDGLGLETFLLGCGAPLQHAIGAVNAMRIGGDVEASWEGIQGPARAAALRSFYQRSAWLNDPDALVVRPPLTLAEARAWASIVALTGGVTMFSDDLTQLPAERFEILQRTIPVAPAAVPGRAVDATVPAAEIAPAVVAGDTVIPIAGPWKLRTGDDPAYGTREYDEEAWETAPVPAAWEHAGHAGYDGFAWYRTRFSLPAQDAASPRRTIALELGRLDDVDATFINGVRVGGTGEFPPNYQSAWQAYRRYPVPVDALNWGGENVLAIRVYDGGGDGGFWNVRRDRPPATWIVNGAARWWTVVVVNWDDEPKDFALPLATLGIAGLKFDAYDVWNDRPLPPLTDTLSLRVDPHSALTVGIRAAAARPQVIGTTRHIVQGAVDLVDEEWVAARRTLKGRAVNLDGRAYAITIAVPKGMRAGACSSTPPCTVRSLASGHVVLEWPASDGQDREWSVSFRAAATGRRTPGR